ncbi:MAG: S9 family peptidase, partial [Bacteroidetes bacterium]|nr:S9 family peptidase [Bacteroidota bacterium]
MKNNLFLIGLLALSLNTLAQRKFTNELIWNSREFNADYLGGFNSMNDGETFSDLKDSDLNGLTIIKCSFSTGDTLAEITNTKKIFKGAISSFDNYSFNADETMLLIETDRQSIYRWSSEANYYVHNLKTGETAPIANFVDGKQRLATISPDKKKIAFVRNNNIFIYDIAAKKELQVTFDGKTNAIINGATDWVYEEEFGFDRGLYWNVDGSMLAYYKFNEELVPEFGMDIFGELYPFNYKFKYPKAGEKNSDVSIHIFEMSSGKNYWVEKTSEEFEYIPRIKWGKQANQLLIQKMNRHQNHLVYELTAPIRVEGSDKWPTAVLMEEKSNTYIDVNDNIQFLTSSNSLIYTSEKSGYAHLYQIDLTKKTEKALTQGNWEIIDFYGIDEKSNQVYFSSTGAAFSAFSKRLSSPLDVTRKYVFSLELKKQAWLCLTPTSGTNDAAFSTGLKYFLHTYSSANSAPTFSIYTNKGELKRTLITNQSLMVKLKEYSAVNKEFFTFQNSSGDQLNCWMMKPANFDQNKKYPVLVAIYGGPGSNTVLDSYGGRNYLWYQLLCQEGYIVVSCDPRGTQYRGRDFKHSTYMNLGKNETNDFIDFAKYLGQQSYIDAGRIGIQGWSYGGYMTSLCMTKGADFYKAGIAVAPVTNWKYYDSVYTERYLRTPKENSGGYENNSPINFAKSLMGKFLLVHGSADDNVHVQNSMDMVTAL